MAANEPSHVSRMITSTLESMQSHITTMTTATDNKTVGYAMIETHKLTTSAVEKLTLVMNGMNQSMKSIRSRRDVDELAFASLGIPSNTGTLTSGYNSQVPYQDIPPSYPVGGGGQFIRQQQVSCSSGLDPALQCHSSCRLF